MIIFFKPDITFADLCVLKTGTYELSSKYDVANPAGGTWDGSTEANTPCIDADVEDGTQDRQVNFFYAAGEDISVDVVFEQSQTPGQQFLLDFFTYTLYFDTSYMRVTSCDPDPAGFFYDNLEEFLGIPACENGQDYTTAPAVVQNFLNFSQDASPDDPVNYLLDTVTFESLYSVSQQNAFTYTFSALGAEPTDVGVYFNGTTCPLFDKESRLCDPDDIEFQEYYASTLSITQPPAVVGQPLSVSLSCRGISGCTNNSGSALAVLKYQSPDVCYVSGACGALSSLCESFGVSFTDMNGEKQILSGDGEFTEVVNVGDVVQYSLKGVEMNGNAVNSSSLKGCQGVLTTSAVTCRCGDPPVIKLVSPKLREIGEDGTTVYNSGQDVEFKFLLDDPDDDLSVGMPDSITKLEFYYSNSTGGASVQKYVPVDLNDNGEFTAYANGSYLKEGQKLYFGVVAVDYDGMETAYPEGFDPADIREDAAFVISNVLDLPAYFGFIPGNEPYPSSFPFIVGNGELSRIYFKLSEISDVTMRIYTMDGRIYNDIRSSEQEVSDAGDACDGSMCNYCNWATGCQWNGMGKDGKDYAGNGMYIVNIHAKSLGNAYMGQELDYTKGIVVMR